MTTKEIKFSTAQVTALKQRVQNVQRAQSELDSFGVYLMDEHGIDANSEWRINRELTGFEKVKQEV